MMNKEKQSGYESPEVEITTISVEKRFAASTDIDGPHDGWGLDGEGWE